MSNISKNPGSLSLLGGLFIVVLTIWAIWMVSIPKVVEWLYPEKNDLAYFGQFGDMFGGLNAFFTAAALAVLLWAGWMQRAELANQREEFSLQRDEMRKGQEVVARQNFESTFFRMLELLRELQDRIRVGGTKGEDAIRRMADDIIRNVTHMADDGNYRSQIGQYVEVFVYPESRDNLGPYFRTLYHLYKLIDETDSLDEEDRIRFSNIVRSQLNSSMIVVVSANGCSDKLATSMSPLIIKYRILKHIDAPVEYMKAIRACYPKEVFLGREYGGGGDDGLAESPPIS